MQIVKAPIWMIYWQNTPKCKPMQVLDKYLWLLWDIHLQLRPGMTHPWSSTPRREPLLCCTSSRTPHMRNPLRGTFGGKGMSCFNTISILGTEIIMVLWLVCPPTDRSRPKGLKNLHWQSHKAHSFFGPALGQYWRNISLCYVDKKSFAKRHKTWSPTEQQREKLLEAKTVGHAELRMAGTCWGQMPSAAPF